MTATPKFVLKILKTILRKEKCAQTGIKTMNSGRKNPKVRRIEENANARGWGIITFTILLLSGVSIQAAFGQDVETAPSAGGILEEVVVTGTRRSLESALETKRNADSIVDGISAEGLNSFPDLNLAEALQRVTGIQIDRDGERRVGTIRIRGLPSAFGRVSFNGQNLAPPTFGTGSVSSGFPMGILESRVFSKATVLKVPTADIDEGGLSGVIDLATRSSLSGKDRTVIGISMQYEELTENTSPGGYLGLSRKNRDETLAFSIDVSTSQQDFRRDTINLTEYLDDIPGFEGINIPTKFRQFVRTNDGSRTTVASSLVWAPSNDLELKLSGIYGESSLANRFSGLRPRWRNNRTVVTALSEPIQGSSGPTLTHLQFDNIEMNHDTRDFNDDLTTYGLTLDGLYQLDDWQIHGAINYTGGSNDHTQQRMTAQVRETGGAGNGITAILNTGAGDPGQYSLVITPDPFFPFAGPFTRRSDTQLRGDSSNVRLNISGRTSVEDNQEYALQLDFERTLDLGIMDSVKFGVKYTDNDFNAYKVRPSFIGINLDGLVNIGPQILTDPFWTSQNAFFGGGVPGVGLNWQDIDISMVQQLLSPLTVPDGGTLEPWGWVQRLTDTENLGTYNGSRDYTAAYAMLRLSGDAFNRPFSGNAGVRFVRTDRTTNATQLLNGTASQITSQNDYTDVLPSVNLMLELSEDVQLRFGYHKGLVRPNVEEFTPITIIDDDTEEGGDIRVTIGSPDLQPYTADSLDLSLEWYNRPGSVVALAIFQKKISAFIDPVNYICPADGGGIGYGPLTLNGPDPETDCVTSANVPIEINNPRNSDETLDILGAEISVQQNLDFLSAPWSNFGGQLNFTYLDVDSADSEVILPGVSEKTFNAIIYYEDERFGVRLAYNKRSEYFLQGTGTFSGGDRVVDSRTQLDLQTEFKVNDKMSVIFKAFNLGEEALIEREFSPELVRRMDYDGRTYTLMINYRLQ